jgi:hypothetical protein
MYLKMSYKILFSGYFQYRGWHAHAPVLGEHGRALSKLERLVGAGLSQEGQESLWWENQQCE